MIGARYARPSIYATIGIDSLPINMIYSRLAHQDWQVEQVIILLGIGFLILPLVNHPLMIGEKLFQNCSSSLMMTNISVIKRQFISIVLNFV